MDYHTALFLWPISVFLVLLLFFCSLAQSKLTSLSGLSALQRSRTILYCSASILANNNYCIWNGRRVLINSVTSTISVSLCKVHKTPSKCSVTEVRNNDKFCSQTTTKSSTDATGDGGWRGRSWDGTVSRLCRWTAHRDSSNSSGGRRRRHGRRAHGVWNNWRCRRKIWRVLWLSTILNIL